MRSGKHPIESDVVRSVVEAVHGAARQLDRRPCYVSGADLAHVGIRFGDAARLTELDLARVRREDHELLECAGRLDSQGFFDAIARHGDHHRICGFPPTYTMLEVLRRESDVSPAGRLLCYDQATEPDRSACVSFAAMGFCT